MKKPVSLDKLSQLQRLILVMLLEERMWRLRRRQFRALAKEIYWGKDVSKAVASASMSRALSRLEERGLIERERHGGWSLSTQVSDLARNGYMYAILAWERGAHVYVAAGFRGPDIKPPERKGVQVNLVLQD
jgi:DNA-binding transcriptional ArsR family regulator